MTAIFLLFTLSWIKLLLFDSQETENFASNLIKNFVGYNVSFEWKNLEFGNRDSLGSLNASRRIFFITHGYLEDGKQKWIQVNALSTSINIWIIELLSNVSMFP